MLKAKLRLIIFGTQPIARLLFFVPAILSRKSVVVLIVVIVVEGHLTLVVVISN
jgi:hypothetical protein